MDIEALLRARYKKKAVGNDFASCTHRGGDSSGGKMFERRTMLKPERDLVEDFQVITSALASPKRMIERHSEQRAIQYPCT